MKKIINWLIGLIGLYICSTILFSADQSLLRIVEYYIPNWVYAPILYRLYFILLFITSVLILFKRNKKIVVLHLMLLLVPIIDTITYLLNYKDHSLVFSHTQNILEIITVSALSIIFGTLLIKNIKKYKAQKTKKYIAPIVIIVAISISFIKPIYIDDWTAPQKVSDEKKELISELNNEFDIESGENNIMYAFFTTNCPFCKMAALKLGINERNNRLPLTYIFFPSKKEDAVTFLKNNKLKNIQYFLVEDKTFLKYAGNSFPSIYFSKNKTIYHWTGSEFNFRALNLTSEK